jgi:hypothetical protein
MKKLLMMCAVTLSITVNAQEKDANRKVFLETNDETAIFSFANIKGAGITNPRFSYTLNGGYRAKQRLNKSMFWFAGIDYRNIGIAQRNDTIRERFVTRYIGPVAGLKFDLKKKWYLGLSTGADFAIYNKDKSWKIGDKKNTKVKQTGYLPDSRNLINPYIGASIKKSIAGIKIAYYPLNHFTTSFTTQDVNLFTIGILLGKEKVSKDKKNVFNSMLKQKKITTSKDI